MWLDSFAQWHVRLEAGGGRLMVGVMRYEAGGVGRMAGRAGGLEG